MPDETPSGAQGWFINTRRDKFKDPRVARRSVYAFDFEWTNKTIMYGAYARTVSPFQNSDMMAKGLPSPEELALLEPFRGKVPDEVFGEPYMPPVSDGSGQDRALLAQAAQLLRDAGCAIKDGKRLTPKGEALKIEFLVDEPSFQPHHMPYIKNLGTLGIEASLRVVDPVQYRARRRRVRFRYHDGALQPLGHARRLLRPFFSSQAASTKGSYNLAGIADPVIDALVERILGAESARGADGCRRAFDRVFRAGRYWIPQWYRTNHPLAYWDVFDHSAKLPRYQFDLSGVGERIIWWSSSRRRHASSTDEISMAPISPAAFC